MSDTRSQAKIETYCYLTLCIECVNGKHGFGGERIARLSSEAHGVCDDCGDNTQVATFRVWGY